MSTFLSLSSTSAAAAERVRPISGETPAQSRTRQTLGGLTQAYHALTMTQKGGWQLIANTLNTNENRVGQQKISAGNAFVTLNSALLACGKTVLSDAPASLAAPPVLPSVTLDAQAPTAATLGDPHFTLSINSPIAYANAVHIQAAAPVPAGKSTFPDNSFKTIGSVPSLTTTPTDITYLYQNTYGPPEPGAQIALRLIAVSTSGIRLTPLVLTGTVTDNTLTKPKGKSPLQIT